MKVLLDTDFLVDVALERRPGTGFIAWHSISNFYYLVAPSRGKASARTFLLDFTKFVNVSATTTDSLRFAGGLNMNDFENALQVAAALACSADFIATRNLRDYAKAPVKAFAPGVALKQLF